MLVLNVMAGVANVPKLVINQYNYNRRHQSVWSKL